MPVSREEWKSVREMVERVLSQRGEYFVTGTVIRRDVNKKLVWIKELGDQPIPIIGFDHEVRYYDETPRGTTAPALGQDNPFKTTPKLAKITVLVPKIGETVVVAKEMGTTRIPRCLGVIQGRDWLRG